LLHVHVATAVCFPRGLALHLVAMETGVCGDLLYSFCCMSHQQEQANCRGKTTSASYQQHAASKSLMKTCLTNFIMQNMPFKKIRHKPNPCLINGLLQ